MTNFPRSISVLIPSQNRAGMAMAHSISASSTRLDPLGTLVYYLCVSIAVGEGGVRVPSGQTISKMLGVAKNGKKPPTRIDPRARQIWSDMLWMHEERLLFDETPVDELQYWLTLSVTNVNRRINGFRPGFKQDHLGERIIEPKEFVEKTITAARLVAWKDLYHCNSREVTQKLLFRFFKNRELVRDDGTFIHFLRTMDSIRYLDVELPEVEKSQPDLRKDFLIEPGLVLRNQDMYIELLALDYFSEQGANSTDRRSERKNLFLEAKDLVARNSKV
jgi:hypothetical protein